MRTLRTSAVAAVTMLTLAGCSGDDDQAPATHTVTQTVAATSSPMEATTTSAPDSTTEDATEQETSAEPTTQAAPPPPSAAPDAASLPRDPAEYADAWVRAWGLGDDTQMAMYADRYVHQQFAGTAGGGTWSRQDSGPYEDGLTFVTYRDGQSGGGLYLLVAPHIVDIGAQHGVISVAQMPPGWDDPVDDGAWAGDGIVPLGLTTDPGEYADIWVRAWGVGDRDTASVYSADDAMQMFGIDSVGGSDWARTSISGEQVRYRDSGGNTLVLVLDLARVAAGAGDGVVWAYDE